MNRYEEQQRRRLDRMARESEFKMNHKKEGQKFFAFAGLGFVGIIVLNLVLLGASVAVILLVLQWFGVI